MLSRVVLELDFLIIAYYSEVLSSVVCNVYLSKFLGCVHIVFFVSVIFYRFNFISILLFGLL